MHGGDIYRNLVKYDFSVNVNPFGIPQGVVSAVCKNFDEVNNYPDDKKEALGLAVSDWLQTQEQVNISPSSIIFGNGASELIPAVLRANNSKSVMLIAPCFTGYKKAINSVNAQTQLFYLKEEDDFELGLPQTEQLTLQLKNHNPDTLILTNPNNPNGKLIEPEIVKKIAGVCKQLKILLLIDECFMTLTGKNRKYSYVPEISDDDNVVILRAFTKTFSMAGLRLGYCLCKNHTLCKSIQVQLPEWNVSTVAQQAGVQALKESEYLEKSIPVICKQRQEMMEKLKALGFSVYSSDSNFILFKSSYPDLKKRLLDKKILIRDCSDYEGLKKGFYRVAVKLEEENKILLKALGEVTNG